MCSATKSSLVQASAVGRLAVREIPEVEAALVFGSVARDSAYASSDVDLLFATSSQVRISLLVAQLKQHCDLSRVAISSNSWSRLEQLRKSGSLFFRHLQVEGRILQDESGRLADLLAPPIVKVDVAAHRSRLARSLALYDDVNRLGDFNLFALAHIYVLGKRAAQLCLQEINRDIYDPDLAFRETMALHPEIADDLELVRRLRNIHASVRGTPPVDDIELPTDTRLVERARTTVGHLLHQ
jgi:predicted nucleotidyltransferase